MSDITNITFKGVSNEPNDYQAEDGQLSVALNAVLHNGSVRAVGSGTEMFSFDKDYKLMLIHQVGDDKVCVFYDEGGSKLIYSEVVNGQLGEEHELCSDVVVDKVTNIRKVLVISTSEGLRYARWDGNAYKYLGAFPKMPYVYPFLNTRAIRYSNIVEDTGSIIFKNSSVDQDNGGQWICEDSTKTIDGELLINEVYNKVFACVNKFKSKIHSEGCFCSPFYVRFALKMYDGTYASVTRPYALFPDSSGSPIVYIGEAEQYNNDKNYHFRKIDSIMPMSTLSVWIDKIDRNWEEIIAGVDVFVSKEVVGYTDSPKGIGELYFPTGNVSTRKPKDKHLYQTCGKADSTISDVHTLISVNELFDDLSITSGGKASLTIKNTFSDSQQLFFTSSSNDPKKHRLIVFKKTDFDKGAAMKENYDFMTPLSSESYNHEYYTILKSEFQIEGKNINDYVVFYIYAGRYYSYFGDDICYEMYEITQYNSGSKQVQPYGFIGFKRDDGNSLCDEFSVVGNFYKIGEIKIDDLKEPMLYSPELNEHDIENIPTKQRLSEDSIRPYEFTAGDVYVYNNRLNTIVEDQCVEDADYIETISNGASGEMTDEIESCYVNVVKDGEEFVKTLSFKYDDKKHPLDARYFFYPSINAKSLRMMTKSIDENPSVKLVPGDPTGMRGADYIKINDTIYYVGSASYAIVKNRKKIRTIHLDKHDSLIGSYCFNGFDLCDNTVEETFGTVEYEIPTLQKFHSGFKMYDASYNEIQDIALQDEREMAAYDLLIEKIKQKADIGDFDDKPGNHQSIREAGSVYEDYNEKLENGISKFHVGNKILQSAPENPFVFLNTGTNEIGCNEIYKLASTTKPISIGQFGEYPLYVFTEKGVWALSTNSDGTYGTIKPVSRDVCNNKDSITQLDQSILFSTSRGIMELQGGDVECITEVLNGHNFTGNISRLEDVLEVCSEEFAGITFDTHIQEFFKDCKIQYDYKRQLIYFFKEGCKLAYVFSLSSRTWGMMYNKGLVDTVTSYTNALVVAEGDSENKLIDLSVTSSDETLETDSLVITRPIMFGTDLHKTIEEIVLRGVYEGRTSASSGELKLVVWASNDMKNWLVIGSSNTDRWRNHSGTPYKAYRIGVVANWNEQDSLNSASVRYTPRMNNKLR